MIEDKSIPENGRDGPDEPAAPDLGAHTFTKKAAAVKAINKLVAMVAVGREIRFVSFSPDGNFVFRRERDAALALKKYRYVPVGKDGKPKELISAFDIWLKSPYRREYRGVVFELDPKKADPDLLNLWRGFAIVPKAGKWSLMDDHMRNNICQGNGAVYVYLISVLAQMFQQPWRKIGIAICLRGGMGVGKTKVSDWLGKMIGMRHAPVIDKPGQLTGRFTGQIEYALLARVEEGFYAGNPQDAAAIKHLITGASIMIERKGVDAYEVPNYTRVLITSNSERPIAAGIGERRYLYLDVGSARKQDGKYFAAIDKEMENGGAAAMLDYLLKFDYSATDFAKPPMTEGLQQQIRLGFSPEEKWLEAFLLDGFLPWIHQDDELFGIDPFRADGTAEIWKERVIRSYRSFVPGFRNVPVSAAQIGTFLKKNIPNLRETRRTLSGSSRHRAWIFPPLSVMRVAFVAAHPGYVFPVDQNDPPVAKEQAPRQGRRSRYL